MPVVNPDSRLTAWNIRSDPYLCASVLPLHISHQIHISALVFPLCISQSTLHPFIHWQLRYIVLLVLKQVHPDTGISNKAMVILNSFINVIQVFNIPFLLHCISFDNIFVFASEDVTASGSIPTRVSPTLTKQWPSSTVSMTRMYHFPVHNR